MPTVKSDIEIARAASLKNIREIGDRLQIPWNSLIPYGHDKAKINHEEIEKIQAGKQGKLVLVTAITPTPAGEGKTTTSVGLSDGLNRIGRNSLVCLREPSLGPSFGMKGGAAGGGYAQVVPMEDINLHFTGDFHAIGAAHNLLSALVDNSIYWDNKHHIDSRRVTWPRVMDMNDRALRRIITSLGGVSNGFPSESGFDITVASEVMAIFCLAKNLQDLEDRLGRIIPAYRRDRTPITAKELIANRAMAVLLKDALQPNLVQTLENNPAIIHGGPFANIAHGCNSVIATKTALGLADIVVTEAGFGADLGAEKFFNIKCRKAGISPDACVIVATARALKHHGGVGKTELTDENVDAVKSGLSNLDRHIRNIKQFGLPVVVAINRFSSDTDAEIKAIIDFCADHHHVTAIPCTHWADGGKGTEDLAHKVAEILDSDLAQFNTLYEDEESLWDKTKTIVRNIYNADGVIADKKVRQQYAQLQDSGFGDLPICMAKTQYSFSTDPQLLGAPTGFDVPIRELRLSAGAGFVVAVCGEVMTMPGLPRLPAANSIHLNNSGEVEGLF